VAVPRGHTLARRRSVRFAETLDHEHVSLPPNSAVQLMLSREAALLQRQWTSRVVVTNFEAAMRVVRAGRAISVVPREIAQLYADSWGIAIVNLSEAWAERRFIICYRSLESLAPAARLLLDALATA
jgi:DNA-binding transcriptional LysR family regulator